MTEKQWETAGNILLAILFGPWILLFALGVSLSGWAILIAIIKKVIE